METKLCGKCGIIKPVTEFYYRWSRRRKDGSLDHAYYSPCKFCRNKQRKERRHNNPDWRLHEVVRDLHGITGKEYKKMCSEQDNVCAICKNGETVKYKGKIRRLSVDHNHKTGKVRGLLCDDCNKGIGCFHEDIKALEVAIAYLKSHS
jgi:hypothetical protein